MPDTDHLMRQNIMEYEIRIRHFDERIARAKQGVGKGPVHAGSRDRLASLELERDKFSVRLDELRMKSLDNRRVDVIEKAGPMGLCDAGGQQLEYRAERLER